MDRCIYNCPVWGAGCREAPDFSAKNPGSYGTRLTSIFGLMPPVVHVLNLKSSKSPSPLRVMTTLA